MNSILVALFSFVLPVGALAGQTALKCSVKGPKGQIDIFYAANPNQMELTKSGDGTLFGSSYNGQLILVLNGKKIIETQADAAGEEYGVIVSGGKLVYANIYLEDTFFTFGQSFDEQRPSFTTNFTRVGGDSSFPETWPASCQN